MSKTKEPGIWLSRSRVEETMNKCQEETMETDSWRNYGQYEVWRNMLAEIDKNFGS